MIRCGCCGHEIEYINANVFNCDGSDSYMSFDIYAPQEANEEAVCIELPNHEKGEFIADVAIVESGAE